MEDFSKLQNLITEKRLRPSTGGLKGILIASESDKGRVINSPSFRRLQQKAQVFPLDPNAAVRTRLTHSIEVSQIGRHIAQQIINKQSKQHDGKYENLAALVNVVETACLLHDIGNPPFGHFGEAAIREWFKRKESPFKDLTGFDGNPQGFRLSSFLAGKDSTGFNLTYSLLLSTIKYPVGSDVKDGNKFGYFSTERDTYHKACNELGWTAGKKFPFMHLMDTADDIAYSLSDLEDGIEKNIITLDELKHEFGKDQFPEGPVDSLINFKTSTINKAVGYAAEQFIKLTPEILDGYDKKLLDGSEVGELIKKINTFARNRIYSHKSAEQVELAGSSVISGLLDSFGRLLDLEDYQFDNLLNNRNIRKNGLDFELRLFRRLPTTYVHKYLDNESQPESLRRSQLIIDFISGMTDNFALETYQILKGIRIQ